MSGGTAARRVSRKARRRRPKQLEEEESRGAVSGAKTLPFRSHAQRGDNELEEQAERVAASADSAPSIGAGVDGQGRVDSGLRRPVEQGLGVDLSTVRLHVGEAGGRRAEELGADALTTGDNIHFAAGSFDPAHVQGRKLIRHELVHAAQQRVEMSEPADKGDGWMSRHEGVLAASEPPMQARRGSLQLGNCGGKKTTAKLQKGKQVSRKEAVAVLDKYKTMTPAERDKKIASLYSYGTKNPPLQNLLTALSKKQVHTTYRAEIRDMLTRVQQVATSAAAGGKSMEDLANIQGTAMEKKFQAAALASKKAQAAAKGLKEPTSVSPQETREAHREHVRTTINFQPQQNAWDALGATKQKAWMKEAIKIRKKIIAEAKRRAPALKLVENDISLVPDFIAKREVRKGKRIFAVSGRPMKVGLRFIATAKANPKYVIGPVLHEIHGHPMHGSKNKSYAWQLFKASNKYFTSYQQPASRTKEKGLYGYPETEIYSEMIEYKYYVPISTADKKKGVRGSDEPGRNIDQMVKRLKTALEPEVVKPILLGMWERFRIDPRLTKGALKLYKKAVNHHFTGLIK